MAELYGGKHVKAWHTNFPKYVVLVQGLGQPLTASLSAEAPKLRSNPILYLKHAIAPYTAAEKAGFDRTKWFDDWSYGYGKLQNTRPQTLGYSLTDSPIGLLAWIYEKLVEWSDHYPWSDDEGKHIHCRHALNSAHSVNSLDLGFSLLVLPSWACSKHTYILRMRG
jgi:hypothetical protein